MERISKHEFTHRLITLCVKSGMYGLPRNPRDRQILLKSVALLLTPGKVYAEAEIASAIRFWLAAVAIRLQTDHVTLRRDLVEQGFLVRDRRGSEYQLLEASDLRLGFDPDVDSVDVLSVVVTATETMQRRRRERFPRPHEDSGDRLLRARDIATKFLARSINSQSACEQLAALADDRFPFLLDLRCFRFMRLGSRAHDRIATLCENAGWTMESMVGRFLKQSEEWIEVMRQEGELE